MSLFMFQKGLTMLGVAEKSLAGLVRGLGKAAVTRAALPAATQHKRFYAAPAKTLPKGQVVFCNVFNSPYGQVEKNYGLKMFVFAASTFIPFLTWFFYLNITGTGKQ